MVLSLAEREEFDKLQKKLDYYWMSVLLPFDYSLRDIDPISKDTALDDFYQKQQDWKPTDVEIERLKSLAHQDPQLAQVIENTLLAIDEHEVQILNRVRP